ncbi:MAG: LysM peptidoglycan-binding domain-containing protein [Elusimicrobiales bacterium]|nr:LysM peptidoglycan-binding domain-containing protein [Elusimicrobiales bacterium]
MKISATFLLALALPAALCAQQGALTGAKLQDEKAKAASSEAKPAQAAEITVIQPGPAKVKAKPAAVKAKSKWASALGGEAKPAAQSSGAAAPGLVVRKGAPVVLPKEARNGGFAVGKKHTVVKGDTLWDLSGKYYKNPFMWGRIYNANFKTVADPDLINPREELYIPDLEDVVLPYRRAPAAAAAPAAADEDGDGAASRAAAKPARASVALSGLAAPGELLRDFDRDFISEEMPEDQREWGSGVRIVPDSWEEDGVVTSSLYSDDPFAGDGLSVTGQTLEISMDDSDAVRPGDYLAIFLKGGDAYDRQGNYLGREVQPAGLAEVISVDGSDVKARVIDAVTAIAKGYIVKKK